MYERIALAFLVGFSFGCSSSDAPLNFNGEYSGKSTNAANTCPGQFPPGQMVDGQVILTQSGEDVQFQTQGATSIVFLVTFGSTSFSGKIDGSHAEAVIVGSVAGREGTCSYTWTGRVSADLSGDTLTGTLTSTPNTNGDPDCDTQKVTGCSRVTSFNYTRLPR
jgi:hypothetical protein